MDCEEWEGRMIRKLAELETGIGIRDVEKERGMIRGMIFYMDKNKYIRII